VALSPPLRGLRPPVIALRVTLGHTNLSVRVAPAGHALLERGSTEALGRMDTTSSGRTEHSRPRGTTTRLPPQGLSRLTSLEVLSLT